MDQLIIFCGAHRTPYYQGRNDSTTSNIVPNDHLRRNRLRAPVSAEEITAHSHQPARDPENRQENLFQSIVLHHAIPSYPPPFSGHHLHQLPRGRKQDTLLSPFAACVSINILFHLCFLRPAVAGFAPSPKNPSVDSACASPPSGLKCNQ